MSLDLELFRLTRKKSADPVARSSGQACTPISYTNTTLQFTAVFIHFTILGYILLYVTDQTVGPFLVCALCTHICNAIFSYFRSDNARSYTSFNLNSLVIYYQSISIFISIVSFWQTMTSLTSKLMWETLHIE